VGCTKYNRGRNDGCGHAVKYFISNNCETRLQSPKHCNLMTWHDMSANRKEGRFHVAFPPVWHVLAQARPLLCGIYRNACMTVLIRFASPEYGILYFVFWHNWSTRCYLRLSKWNCRRYVRDCCDTASLVWVSNDSDFILCFHRFDTCLLDCIHSLRTATLKWLF